MHPLARFHWINQFIQFIHIRKWIKVSNISAFRYLKTTTGNERSVTFGCMLMATYSLWSLTYSSSDLLYDMIYDITISI